MLFAGALPATPAVHDAPGLSHVHRAVHDGPFRDHRRYSSQDYSASLVLFLSKKVLWVLKLSRKAPCRPMRHAFQSPHPQLQTKTLKGRRTKLQLAEIITFRSPDGDFIAWVEIRVFTHLFGLSHPAFLLQTADLPLELEVSLLHLADLLNELTDVLQVTESWR